MILFLIDGCASHQMPSIPGITPPGEDEEVRISREFRREAKKELKFLSNLEVQRYVENVGRRLLSVMGPQQFDYRYFVIEESELNAFSVPGGSIYLFTGLLDRMRSTAELASVMAHETIHAKNHHMVRMSGLDPVSILGILGAVALARAMPVSSRRSMQVRPALPHKHLRIKRSRPSLVAEWRGTWATREK